jgi:hypothetical protein
MCLRNEWRIQKKSRERADSFRKAYPESNEFQCGFSVLNLCCTERERQETCVCGLARVNTLLPDEE